MKRKVMCVMGTRPEAVKMSCVIKQLKKNTDIETIVVSTAQHREMLDQMLEWFQITPDIDLNLMQHGQSLCDLTARVLRAIDKTLQENPVDLLLVQGDTVTVMAAGLAAFYHQIKLGHIEAGLRTHNKYNPFPEEMARLQTSRLADLHFAPTKLSIENLRQEGITENVYLTGNTVIDSLYDTANRLKDYKLDFDLFGKTDFEKYKVILVTAHRRENWEHMENIAEALRQIVLANDNVQVLFPVHKNPLIRKAIANISKGYERIQCVEPLDYVPFVYAMQKCFLILTDSGGIQEEAPSFKKPCLVLRTNTERPEAVQAGTSKLIGCQTQNIVKEVLELINNADLYDRMAKQANPFGDGTASIKIAEIVKQFLQ